MPDRPRPAGSGGDRSRGRIPEERLWQVGFLVGSVLGAAITVAGRQVERSARAAGLVDWRQVERIAVARLRSAPGSLPASELRAVEGEYAAAMERVVPALGAHLGTELPGVVDRVAVVDRGQWVEANTVAFAHIIGKLEDRLLEQMLPEGSGFGKATMTLANRWVTTRQLGLLLGFMGQRVLGQYDLALLSAETTPGRLLFVEENIRQTAKALDVPVGPFRTWIALHETTHAFEFEAHPWLRPYLADRLERQVSLFSQDASALGRDAMKAIGQVLRGEGRRDDQHWMERLMSDEQRRLFRETQAVMSLLEGFGDHVMDEVGKDLVPGVERISARFHGRRMNRTAFERAMLRITGMDLKMEQYRKGEAFVAEIERLAGAAALRRLWDGPETLPRPEEIDRPADWVRRVGLNQLEGGTA
ncbi:MAG TPA: zinc-dependent metalloprotease [Candidatus Limnocylindrales bacterium]|nr:zinc-dependent metalloprotease [Candidatus Limnocylindrales bacterium]